MRLGLGYFSKPEYSRFSSNDWGRFFCKKNAKKENRLCPLPYEEVLEDIIKTVGQNNVGISKN